MPNNESTNRPSTDLTPERPKIFEDTFLSRLRQADAQSEADRLEALEQGAVTCDDGDNQRHCRSTILGVVCDYPQTHHLRANRRLQRWRTLRPISPLA